MRQGMTHTNAYRGGCSFSYRDIFSGLSNEKMGPVPSIPLLTGFLILQGPHGSCTTLPVWFPAIYAPAAPSPRGHAFGQATLQLPKCLCILKGCSLVLLKTNFAKKPKNPV